MENNASQEIKINERLIVALDVASQKEALDLVDCLGEQGRFYKIGLELFAAGEGALLTKHLLQQGKKVFVDLKLFDVPETVKRATARVVDLGAHFLTVHGNDEMIKAAVSASAGSSLKILAVTALTSLDKNDLQSLGFQCDISDLVLSRAKRALALGCEGVVSSGMEVPILSQIKPKKPILVTPGVRPVDNCTEDDQKRIATVTQIINAGGDYCVIGRPIKNAPHPLQAMQSLLNEIKSALEAKTI